MALYLYEATYAGESWATQLRRQENVVDRLQPLAKALGGQVNHVWYSFGESDIFAVIDMPDDEAVAAFALAIAAGGSIRAQKTVRLLTVEQGLASMKKAADAGSRYRPPVG